MTFARVFGLVLCGGGGRRFSGGLKEEALLEGRMLIEHVIARARPQVSQLALSRSAHEAAGRLYGLEVVRDRAPDAGPVAGLEAGLAWAARQPGAADALALFACDTPIFPDDHVKRLAVALGKGDAGCALPFVDGRAHPAMGLWRVDMLAQASAALRGDIRSLLGLADRIGAVTVAFAGAGGAFANVNTRADLEALEQKLAGGANPARDGR